MGTSAILVRVLDVAGRLQRKSHPSAEERRRNTRDFILNVAPDEKRRWALYFATGLLIIGLIVLTISCALGTGVNNEVADTAQQAGSSSGEVSVPEQGAILKQSALFSPAAKMQQVARSLASGTEAEAAIEPVALARGSFGEAYPAKSVSRPERGSPGVKDSSSLLDREVFAKTPKLEQSGDPAVKKQVEELLATVKSACESEDKETLLGMLDDQDPSFHKKYLTRAERLFRSFDDISVSFSGIKVYPLNEQEVLVKLHVRVEGAFSFTGAWKVISNSDQCFTLRRHGESDWRLCSVNQSNG